MSILSIQPLAGHVSEETAYVVDDYPYGFRLRCKIRYWIETSKHGQRFCSQTTNPKLNFEKWNAPKKSTYSDLRTMYLDTDDGHIHAASLSFAHDEEPRVLAYIATYGSVLTSDYEVKAVRYARMVAAARRIMEQTLATAGKGLYDFPADERIKIVRDAQRKAAEELELEGVSLVSLVSA